MGDIMENETRMSKYKELREKIRAEMDIEQTSQLEKEEDDDYLGFMVKTYNDITYDKDDEFAAQKYDAKMEILNKIKQMNTEPVKEKKSFFKEKNKETSDSNHKKLSFLEKLARLSSEEDKEKLKEFQKEENEQLIKEEQITEEPVENIIKEQSDVKSEDADMNHSLLDFVSLLKKDDIQKVVKEDKMNEVKETDNEELEEDEPRDITDYIIIGLMIALVAIFLLIVKQMF